MSGTITRRAREPPGYKEVKTPPPPSSSTMCNMTKIENLSTVKKTGTSILKKKSSNGRPSPAFRGAKFDKKGYCLKHPTTTQLASPQKDDKGKLIYQELKATCPSCQTAKHKSKKTTSLGGGKVKTGHKLHGTRSRSKSRGRRGDLEEELDRSTSLRSIRSKSRDRNNGSNNNRGRKEHATPFDAKGRCHYHKNVQLAAKKQFGGGWKVLHSGCPKCMEDSFEADRGCGDDNRSVRSGRSSRSGTSGGGDAHGDAHGQFDKNGCCILHTHIQVAKKKVFGSGFKVVRVCPACEGSDVNADDYSVKSGRSARSASSRKSTRSAKSNTSKSKPGKASKSGRYGAMPFDGDGYCCRHPNVQLAKKKTLGGFKIVHDVCPECTIEDDRNSPGSGRRRSSSSRRRSGTGRVFDDAGSETSSFKSGKSKSSGGSSARKKKIRVRNLKTEDEEGKHGRYSGYVNDDHQPHGNGLMKYEDGSVYDGVWSEGSKVHGKTKKRGGSGRF